MNIFGFLLKTTFILFDNVLRRVAIHIFLPYLYLIEERRSSIKYTDKARLIEGTYATPQFTDPIE